MRPALHRRGNLIRILVVTVALASRAHATVWYVGAFSGSTPLDDADCGGGKGAHPAPHPCASLAYWTSTHAFALPAGDTVRLTGTLGPAASGFHCVIPAPGVTYEGRTADDQQPTGWDDAIVDAALTLAYPCHSGAVNCRGDSACRGFSNLTLRYLTLANATGRGGEGNQLMPGGAVQSGLTIDHVRFTGSRSNGLVIGTGVANEDNPCNGVRNVHDITILDSQFDHNTRATAQAGLWLTCTDGGVVRRVTAFDNRGDNKTQADCMAYPDTEGCDGRNGFHFGGWINGTIAESSSHDNGYYNYDFSGNGPSTLCDAPTHDLLVDAASSYNAADAHYSFSHCNHDITLRNSFAWGPATALNQYACAYRLRVYNNTFWTRKAVQLFANCRECDFRNNVFRCDSDRECVYVDFASRNALTTWTNNVVVNAGSGPAFGVFDSNRECVGTPGGACDCPGSDFAVCPNSDPQSPGCPSPWKDDVPRHFANGDLAAFVQDAMFGAETGSGDRWGAPPLVVDPSAPDAAGLHLLGGDTVARGAGLPLPAALFGIPSIDWDGDARPASGTWDAGADQIVCPGAVGRDRDGDGIDDACDPDDAPLGPMTVHLRWSHDAKLGGGSVKADGTGDPIDPTGGLVLELRVGGLERTFAWSASDCQGAERIVCKLPHRAKMVLKGSSFSAAFAKADLPAQAPGPVDVRLAEGAVTAGIDHTGTAQTCTERSHALKCTAP